MSRRRLTNDLEELSMGVRTLRKKFQVAGSVVATVGWWRHLKEMKDQSPAVPTVGNDGLRLDTRPLMASSVDHDQEYSSSSPASSPLSFTTGEMPDPESPPLGRSLSQKKEGRSLQNIFIANEESLSKSPAASQPFMGLRSPPLTPKGPLAGSSLSSLQESHFASHHHHKSRPLSIIPDLDETSMAAMALSSIASPEMTAAPSAVTMNTTTVMMAEMPPSFPLIDDALLEKLAPGRADNEQELNESDRRTEEGEEGSALPSTSTPAFMDMFSPLTTAGEQQPQEVDSAESQDTAEQQEKTERENDDDDWEAVENEPEMEDGQSPSPVQVTSVEDFTTAAAKIPADSLAASQDDKVSQETEPLTEIDEAESSTVKMVAEKDGASTIDKEQDPTEQVCQASAVNDDDADDEDRAPEGIDGWVQALWRFLIRAEYFFLGTAVLGAFMPENWLALCAGFLSAVMYGMLVIRYKFLISTSSTYGAQSVEGGSAGRQQGPVPPQPPKGNVRRRRVQAGARSP